MKCAIAALTATVGIVASAAALAPAAHADGLGGISGWEPSTPVCGNSSLFPVLVSNATNEAQTGSITVPEGLSAQVQVFSTQQEAYDSVFASDCAGRPEVMSAPAFQTNFTVPAGQTEVFWMGVGGVDYNLIGDSHSFGIGGLPSGTNGASWYDVYVNLNADESFSSMHVAYQGTGGTNYDNGQNGFNFVQCSTANGGLNPTGQILTPYSSKASNSPSFSINQPMCLGWAPVGQMLDQPSIIQSFGPSTLNPLAAQLNNGLGQPAVSIAGTLPEGVTLTSAQADNGGYQTPLLTTQAGSVWGWVTTQGNEWAIVDLPVSDMTNNSLASGFIVWYSLSDGSTGLISVPNVPGVPE